MDILRALATPNMDIRKKTLDIALDLVSPQNIDEAILYLKKEIAKTQSAGFEKVLPSLTLTNQIVLTVSCRAGWGVQANVDSSHPRLCRQISICGQ